MSSGESAAGVSFGAIITSACGSRGLTLSGYSILFVDSKNTASHLLAAYNSILLQFYWLNY